VIGLTEPRHLFFVAVGPMLIAALAALWLSRPVSFSSSPSLKKGSS